MTDEVLSFPRFTFFLIDFFFFKCTTSYRASEKKKSSFDLDIEKPFIIIFKNNLEDLCKIKNKTIMNKTSGFSSINSTPVLK